MSNIVSPLNGSNSLDTPNALRVSNKSEPMVESNDFTQEHVDKTIKFPYKLDTFQLDAIKSIENGEHVLVTAHTSAGKSTVAEFAIAKALHTNKKVIYTSPIKALSNQKYFDFSQKCKGDVGLFNGLSPNDIGIMTGDIKKNPDAQVVIMTTEILRNSLYKDNEFLSDVAYVVFDEVHYINDKDRGRVWEESIVMLPKGIIMIMLSATIGNAANFANWITTIKGRNTQLVSTLYRPVPLGFFVYMDNNLHKIIQTSGTGGSMQIFDSSVYESCRVVFEKMNAKRKYNHKWLINNVTEHLSQKDLLPCIFFSFSRKNCERYASYITNSYVNHEERSEIEKIFDFHLHRSGLTEKDRMLSQFNVIRQLILKGVGIHHSGLLPILKEILEILFSKGLIKVLFATETFAIGVNMPTKTVIFTEVEKFDNSGKRFLRADEFMQMSGRAGRRGMDTVGTVIYLPLRNYVKVQFMRNVMLGKVANISSQFVIEPHFVLKAIETNNYGIMEIINSTYFSSNMEDMVKSKQQLNEQELVKIKELDDNISEHNTSIGIGINIDTDTNVCKLITDYIHKRDVVYVNEMQNKKKKRIQKELLDIENNMSSNDKLMLQLMDKKHQLQVKYDKSLSSCTHIKNDVLCQLEHNVHFLVSLGYLAENAKICKDYESNESNEMMISKEDLTIKGIMACSIHECNPILIVELLVSEAEFIESLSVIELICILSLFVESSSKGNTVDGSEFIVSSSYILPDGVKNAVKKIECVNERIKKSCRKFGLTDYMESECRFSDCFIEYAYLWGKGDTVEKVYTNTDLWVHVYEGNFIRNILKIVNVVKELSEVVTLVNKPELLVKLRQCEEALYRDLITVQSLYV
jgi:superfamily II RNA helicase